MGKPSVDVDLVAAGVDVDLVAAGVDVAVADGVPVDAPSGQPWS